ncbi:hypothetical protein GJ744_002887 [Endocarpon pusillum]|uniref:MOSC domain-containing protein n=1 Tax=Endocarpon pusillum TaxID=364733 RepID=A0A8H7E0Y8_9EURO|nr:hypothetical protein GJ744_002887 [Endocarpon pusillum]
MSLIPRLENLFDHARLLAYPLCLLPIFLLLWTKVKHQKQLRTALRGCKKLGLHGSSNLSDEYHPKYTKSNPDSLDATSTEAWKIKALFVYPIKSCAAVELDTADISSTGLTWDRQFCFAEYTVPTQFPTGTPDSEKKKPRWTFRTLRKPGYESLVHVRPEIWVPDPQYARMNHISDPNLAGVLVINYPNIPRGTLPTRLVHQTGQLLHLMPKESSFHVPLLPPKQHTYPLEPVSIWKEIPFGYNYGRHVPAEFKAYLKIPDTTPFTLFRASPAHYREVYRNAPRRGPAPGQVPYQPIVAFPDSYPVHLLNLASVRDVAGRVKSTIPHLSAGRFRPNILITGPAAYDEDDWKGVRVLHRHHQKTPTITTTPPSAAAAPPPPPAKANPKNGELAAAAAEPSDPPSSVDFHTACHTLRCRLPNVDPLTGIRHPSEPDRTLKSFRCIDRGDERNAALGLQLVPARPGNRHEESGTDGRKEDDDDDDDEKAKMKIAVGDEIEVLDRGELVYVRY